MSFENVCLEGVGLRGGWGIDAECSGPGPPVGPMVLPRARVVGGGSRDVLLVSLELPSVVALSDTPPARSDATRLCRRLWWEGKCESRVDGSVTCDHVLGRKPPAQHS